MDGLGDTLDLVPVGAWHGNGRKAGWWSPVLLAVWDSTTERLVAVCKCMSGKVQWHHNLRRLGSWIGQGFPTHFTRYDQSLSQGQ